MFSGNYRTAVGGGGRCMAREPGGGGSLGKPGHSSSALDVPKLFGSLYEGPSVCGDDTQVTETGLSMLLTVPPVEVLAGKNPALPRVFCWWALGGRQSGKVSMKISSTLKKKNFFNFCLVYLPEFSLKKNFSFFICNILLFYLFSFYLAVNSLQIYFISIYKICRAIIRDYTLNSFDKNDSSDDYP